MKKPLLFLTILIAGAAVMFLSFTSINAAAPDSTASNNAAIEIPENVQQVIDKSCFGCHNSESRSDKAKKKLQWDKLGELKTYKLVGTLSDISDVVTKHDMPPKEFLEKKPEATPTAVEKKILAEWAESTAKMLVQ